MNVVSFFGLSRITPPVAAKHSAGSARGDDAFRGNARQVPTATKSIRRLAEVWQVTALHPTNDRLIQREFGMRHHSEREHQGLRLKPLERSNLLSAMFEQSEERSERGRATPAQQE